MKNFTQYLLYKVYSCIAFAAPLAALFVINKDAYITTSSGGTAIAFWGYVVAIFGAIGFKRQLGDFIKKRTTLSIALGVFVVALIMEFLARQLMLISAATIAGSLMSEALDPVVQVYYDRCYKHTTDNRRIRIKAKYLPQKEAWKQAYTGLPIDIEV
jgi:uncharacterized protein with PQ loop repeat